MIIRVYRPLGDNRSTKILDDGHKTIAVPTEIGPQGVTLATDYLRVFLSRREVESIRRMTDDWGE